MHDHRQGRTLEDEIARVLIDGDVHRPTVGGISETLEECRQADDVLEDGVAQ